MQCNVMVMNEMLTTKRLLFPKLNMYLRNLLVLFLNVESDCNIRTVGFKKNN